MPDTNPFPRSEPMYGNVVGPSFQRPSREQQISSLRRPQRYVTGDAMYGWRIVDEKPASDNLTWQGQNFVRDKLNTLENPRGLFGDNPRAVAERNDLLEAARGTPATEGQAASLSAAAEGALGSLIPFYTPGSTEQQAALEAVDPDFSGMGEWREWEREHPDVASFLKEYRGFKPEEMLSGARNRDAFMLTINMEMTKAQLQQEIDEYEKSAGTYSKWSQFIGGGFIRNFIVDPDAGRTVGLASAGKLVSTAGKVAGISAIERGARLGAAHNFMAKNLRLGTAGALAAEGAVTGAMWSAQHQIGMQQVAESLGQADLEYRIGDTLEAGALGAVFGLGLWGAGRAVGAMGRRAGDRERGIKEAVRAMGMEDHPLERHGLTPEGLTTAALEEDAFVKINRALGDAVDNRLGILLSEDVITASGRTMPEVGQFVDRLSTMRRNGIKLSDEAMVEVLDDFLGQGTAKFSTLDERLKVERAIAGEELLRMRQSNPAWRASMERDFQNWFDAMDRIGERRGTLSVEEINQILAGTGVRTKVAADATDVAKMIQSQMTAIDDMLTKRADPAAAAASVKADIKLGFFEPKSAAGRLVRDIDRQLSIIAEAQSLKGKQSGNATKAAREELRQLNAKLNELYGKAPPTPRKKPVRPPSAKALDRMPEEEQSKVIRQIMAEVVFTPTEVMTSTTLMNKALKAVGYDGPIKKLLTSRTTASKTTQSQVAFLRNIADLFGSNTYTSQSAAGRGGAGVGFHAARGRAVHEPMRIRHFLEEFANRSDVSSEAFAKFNYDVRVACDRGVSPKGIPFEREAQELYGMIKDYTKAVIDRGRANKSLTMRKGWRKSIQLPSIVNEPLLRARLSEATDLLVNAWRRDAQQSDALHPEFLVAMGWADQPTNQFGQKSGSIRYRAEGPLGGYEGRTAPTRAALNPEQLAQYLQAVENNASIRNQAGLHWNRQLQSGRDTNVRTMASRVFGPEGRRYGAGTFDQKFLDRHPELREFHVNDLFTLVDNFSVTAGFKSHLGDSIKRRFGVNATLGQLMKSLETEGRVLFSGDAALSKEVNDGFDKVYDMIAQAGGYLPDTDASSNVVRRFAMDTLSKAAAIPVLGGMGLTNAAEGLIRMFTMVHNPVDVGRNAKAFTRSLFASKEYRREQLAGMHQDLRHMSTLYAHQLSTGRIDAAFELTTRGKLALPYKDAWRLITGKQKSNRYPGRIAPAVLSTIDGLGKTAYLLGAGPRIQQATEIMVARAAQREIMRYGDAAIKLRSILKDAPIDPNDAGAAHKAFVAAARKAGFGDRWDVAQRVVRYNLMEDGMIESLQEVAKTTRHKDKMHVRLDDMFDAYAKMADGPEKARLYESSQRFRQYIEDRIKEELGEVSPWSARLNSRSPEGRALDMFTNYIHNMYFHKFAQSASMPSRVFMGVLTGFVVVEVLQSLLASYLQGETEEEILKRWNTPEEAIGQVMSTSFRAPVFGGLSFITKPVFDSVNNTVQAHLGNEETNAFQPKFGGIVGSAMDNMWRLGRGAGQWAFALTPEGQDRGQNTFINAGLKYLPVVNSAYGKAAIRTFTDLKQKQSYHGRRELEPLPSGRSIWGEEDVLPLSPAAPANQESATGFDLKASLLRNK